jgi:hypothetical protein
MNLPPAGVALDSDETAVPFELQARPGQDDCSKNKSHL